MKRLLRILTGFLLLPWFYARYGFLVILPFAIYSHITEPSTTIEIMLQILGFVWFIWSLFFVFLFGNCGVMGVWTKLWHKIFKVKYKNLGNWTTGMMHSHSVWTHPEIEIRGKSYKLTYAEMGGNVYDSEHNLRRKILFIWLFN